MKLQHFKELVSNISRDLTVGESSFGHTTIVKVSGKQASLVAIVSGDEMFSFNTLHQAFMKIDSEKKEMLLDVITKFSSTPIDKRKDDPKYHWFTRDHYSSATNRVADRGYLNLIDDESISIDTKTEVERLDYRTLFTVQEFWEIVERFRLDIDEFEKELPTT